MQGEHTRRSSAVWGGAVSLPAPLPCQRNRLPPLHLRPLQTGGARQLPGGCPAVAMVSSTLGGQEADDNLCVSVCLTYKCVLPLLSSHSLADRTFKTVDFYRKHQDNMTPAGLAFFQCQWDESVTNTFHNTLSESHQRSQTSENCCLNDIN